MAKYTAAEVAEELGVSLSRVYQARASMGLGILRGGVIWFTKAEVAKIRDRRGAVGAPPRKRRSVGQGDSE